MLRRNPPWGSSTADPSEGSQTCPRPRSKPQGCSCCHLVVAGSPQFPTSVDLGTWTRLRGASSMSPQLTLNPTTIAFPRAGDATAHAFLPLPGSSMPPQGQFYKRRLPSTTWNPEGDEVPGQNIWPPQTAE